MEYVKLGEVATFINGYAFKPSDWKKEGIPIIRIQNLTGNNREINYYQGKIDEKYHVKKGEILISWSASIDVYEWKGENGYLNQHIFKVVFDKMDIDKDFFVYLIKNKLNEIKKYTHGSTMKHITKSKFDNIKIRIPSKEEQIKIANKLNKIIIIIEKQKEQLELLENLKKSQFFEMFGDPIKNEKGWEVTSMDEISIKKGEYGSNKPSKIYEGGYRYIRITDIKENGDLKEEKVGVVDEDIEVKKYKLEEGDILFARSGATVGKTFLYRKEFGNCIFAGYLIRFKLDISKVNSEYIKRYTETEYYKKWVESCQNIVAQPNINAKKYGKELKIILPPLELQNKFATKIEAIQKLKFRKLKSLEKTENSKIIQKFLALK